VAKAKPTNRPPSSWHQHQNVEKHREHLMEKLDIHDTAGLTRYAIEAGIIESSVH